MSTELFVRGGPGETRYGLTVDGLLIRQFVHRDLDQASVDSVYVGRIVKIHPGLNAAFVELGENNEGFLSATDAQFFNPEKENPQPISELFTEGEKVVVQVQREGFQSKGARLTTRIQLVSRNLVLTPSRPGVSISRKIIGEDERKRLRELFSCKLPTNCGLVVRTSAIRSENKHLLMELDHLVSNWSHAVKSVSTSRSPSRVIEPPPPVAQLLIGTSGHCEKIFVNNKKLQQVLFSNLGIWFPELTDNLFVYKEKGDVFSPYDLLDQWAALYEKKISLESGGRIVIDETAALTVIDVDSGSRLSNRRREDFNLAVNLEAAAVIAHQIQLRELAGQIVIDFLPLRRKKNRQNVEKVLTMSMDGELGDLNVIGFSAMGLFELTRRRRRRSFYELNLVSGSQNRRPLSLAYDILYSLNEEWANHPGRRLCIKCTPDISKVLQQGVLAHNLKEIEKQYGSVVEFETELRQADDSFELSFPKKSGGAG